MHKNALGCTISALKNALQAVPNRCTCSARHFFSCVLCLCSLETFFRKILEKILEKFSTKKFQKSQYDNGL